MGETRRCLVTAVAVITGASSGIGLATAERFVAAGYHVASLSRRSCPIASVMSVHVDLSADNWTNVVSSWINSNIVPNTTIILVHNAAAAWHDDVRETGSAQLRAMLELSVVVPQALNRMFLPQMGSGSAIIYVGSTLSTKAVPNSFSYVTAKHALVGMMRATCQDLYGRAIHTACVCPGITDTPMLHSLYDSETVARLSEIIGLRRLIEPREVAEAIYAAATTPIFNGALINADYGQLER
jgi:3-oxoacyl-[acyl-carrier protein] reductase